MAQGRGLTLVTGAHGFIGRHLVAKLAGLGWPTRALIRAPTGTAGLAGSPEIARGDILDRAAMARATAGVDTCIHLAAQSSVAVGAEDPDLTMRTNAAAVADLLAACGVNGVRRFVLLSTIHVFGPAPARPLTATTPFDPRSAYALSKLEAERLVFGFDGAMDVVVLRPSNVYGPGQSRAAVVADMVARAVAGEPITVRDPAVRRDFVYVGDIVQALVAAASTPAAAGHAIDIESGQDITIGHLARLIWRAAGQPVPDDDDSATDQSLAGPTLADRLLGWRPTTSLPEGLAACVAAERERLRGMA
jgi:UDP-glucose 4-epimerase